jgi:hypothetical protein
MRKTVVALLSAAAFGLMGASGAWAFQANGAALGQLGQQTDGVLQVRDGCGRAMYRDGGGSCRRGCGPGWHYSNRAGHCVTGPKIISPGE